MEETNRAKNEVLLDGTGIEELMELGSSGKCDTDTEEKGDIAGNTKEETCEESKVAVEDENSMIGDMKVKIKGDEECKPPIIMKFQKNEAYFKSCKVKDEPAAVGDDELRSPRSKRPRHVQTKEDQEYSKISPKRTLRRCSNGKDSVLQTAIALKEKSLRISESSVAVNTRKKKDSDKSAVMAAIYPDAADFSKMVVEMVSNGCLEDKPEETINGYGKKAIQVKKKRRYFKGLSYSFTKRGPGSKRGKKRAFNRRNETSTADSSIDTKSIDVQDGKTDEEGVQNGESESSYSLASNASESNYVKENAQDNVGNDVSDGDDIFEKEEIVEEINSVVPNSKKEPHWECLCEEDEAVYRKASNEKDFLHCQAVDLLENRAVGCAKIVEAVDGEFKLFRANRKIPFGVYCKKHVNRLLSHMCCPKCGFFCNRGVFVVCPAWHLYHRKCELVIEGNSYCPHCSLPSPSHNTVIGIASYSNPVFLPVQMEKSGKCSQRAKMSLEAGLPSDSKSSPPFPIVSACTFKLPDGREITSNGLPDSVAREKLDLFLCGLLSDCSSDSPYLQRGVTYRTLYQAAKAGDVPKLLLCLKAGLNPNHVFREWVMGSVLHAACMGGFITIVHLLVMAGAQLDLLDREQNTPLMLAALHQHNDIVKYLVKSGACVSFKGQDGMTALHLAAKSGNMEACYLLMTSPKVPNRFVNTVDEGGWTALVWAAEHNHEEIVRFLLAKGADPAIRDTEKNIALHWAAYGGSVDIAEALLSYDSDVNCANFNGDTPLHIAARQNHYACVVVLLARGARVDLKNKRGLTAIECCLEQTESYTVIELNVQLKAMTESCKERTLKVLTNDITNGYEINPIQCVNGVDDEDFPKDFVYVVENCFTSDLNCTKTISSLSGCTCMDSCSSAACLCAESSVKCWYDSDKKLLPDFNYSNPPTLFECNSTCKCNKMYCRNRVVQHNMTGRFQLFRTQKKGWGVTTLRLIPQGTYVCEYIGELISDKEADTREEDAYLFDLDNHDGETFCIDARRYGNIARFINHSCNPNLQAVKVFMGHQDLRFPRMAFFAKRDIQPYEELGFDYGTKFWIIKYKLFTCDCKSISCRYSSSTINKSLEEYMKK